MRDRNYNLVIMDSTGRSTKRLRVERRQVVIAVASFATLVLLLLALGVHGLLSVGGAIEAQRVADENIRARALIGELESKLPALESMLAQARTGALQLAAKSHLGVETRMLGMGPVESSRSEAATSMDTASSSAILAARPSELPDELTRLENDSRKAQQVLDELLEYFNDAARLLSNTPSVRPVRTHITSRYGKRRDPMHGHWVMHKGIDMGGYIGMDIYAPADGEVIWTGRRGGYGVTVVIDHGYGLQTHYAHLSKSLVNIGDKVQRGDLVAEMGNTGRSTGPHLHYEVRRNGQPLDPMRFVLD